MDSRRSSLKRPLDSPLICRICGDVARGMNFDVITCMSCKAFFRRNALRPSTLHCQLENHCDIDQRTRSACSACRLKKCFELGMKSDLIRSPYQGKSAKKMKKADPPAPQPQPLSLLNQDRSMLTFDEWNLLSNIIHAYDEQNLAIRTQHFLQQQLTFHPKIRSKATHALEVIGSFYSAVQPLLERTLYFRQLPSEQRRLIVQNNLCGSGTFNSMIAAVEANVYGNQAHIDACNKVYGKEYVEESHRVLKRLETNLTLLKILLLILAFASNSSIVIFDHSYDQRISHHTVSLLKIQDVFVTMIWKYLIYQYGYIEAVKRFSNIVKNFLDTLNRMRDNHSEQHWQMVDVLVEKMHDVLVVGRSASSEE